MSSPLFFYLTPRALAYAEESHLKLVESAAWAHPMKSIKARKA